MSVTARGERNDVGAGAKNFDASTLWNSEPKLAQAAPVIQLPGAGALETLLLLLLPLLETVDDEEVEELKIPPLTSSPVGGGTRAEQNLRNVARISL